MTYANILHFYERLSCLLLHFYERLSCNLYTFMNDMLYSWRKGVAASKSGIYNAEVAGL